MSFLILIRHGQSTWNLEKRFTGWVDVDLTDRGRAEAEKAGLLIKKKNIEIPIFKTFYKPINLNKFDKSKKYLAFAGIGNPEDFKKILIKNDLNIVSVM